MALMEWNSTLSVSVPGIDAQHQKLIALVNRLHDAMRAGKGAAMIGAVLDELVAYTRTHFAHEEALMRAHRYPGADAHVAEHRKLVSSVEALQADLKAGQLLSMTVMEFLQSWLSTHICQSDKQYTPYLTQKVA